VSGATVTAPRAPEDRWLGRGHAPKSRIRNFTNYSIPGLNCWCSAGQGVRLAAGMKDVWHWVANSLCLRWRHAPLPRPSGGPVGPGPPRSGWPLPSSNWRPRRALPGPKRRGLRKSPQVAAVSL